MMSKKSRQELNDGSARSEGSTQKGNMSSPIVPTQGPTGPSPVDRVAGAGSATPAAAEDAQSVQGAAALAAPVSVEATPSSPPPEVLAQVSEAADAYGALAAEGREVRFSTDESGRGATAQLVDSDGNVLAQLSPAQAIALALGGDGTEPGEPV